MTIRLCQGKGGLFYALHAVVSYCSILLHPWIFYLYLVLGKCTKSFGIKETYSGLIYNVWKRNQLQLLFAAAHVHFMGLVGFTVTATVSRWWCNHLFFLFVCQWLKEPKYLPQLSAAAWSALDLAATLSLSQNTWVMSRGLHSFQGHTTPKPKHHTHLTFHININHHLSRNCPKSALSVQLDEIFCSASLGCYGDYL